MKRFISISLFFVVCNVILNACNRADEQQQHRVNIEAPRFNPAEEVPMDAQIEANEVLTDIAESGLSKTKLLYDSYYGGGFMDENGNLTILVKNDTTIGPKIVGNAHKSARIKYQECKYSLAELNSIIDMLNEYAKTNDNSIKHNMSAWCVAEDDNSVEVYLYDTSYSAVQEFKASVINNDAIKFLQGEAAFIE